MLKNSIQGEMLLSPYSELYDILIKDDNYWRQLNDSIDFSFLYDELKDNYSSQMGRTAVNPIIMFKYMLLKSYYKLSDRDLIARTLTDMEFKYFLGYSPEETDLINHSLLSKFRKLRLKDINILDLMITKTVELAINAGIINTKSKIILDSTHSNSLFHNVSQKDEILKRAKELRKATYQVSEKIKEYMPSKVDNTNTLEEITSYCNKVMNIIEEDSLNEIGAVSERMNYLKEGLEDLDSQKNYSKDEEAKTGHKSKDTHFDGYKTHIAMSEERIITAATITTGEKSDGKELEQLVEKSEQNGLEIEAVIGDGAYSSKEIIEYTKKKNIKLASKLSKAVTHGLRKKDDKFEFNKDANMYVCPAGHLAVRKAKTGKKDQKVESYYFDVEKCKICQLKNGCYKEGASTKTYNVKIKDEVHIEHMDYMNTEEFNKLYSERYKIEAKNAELKKNYNYDKAQSCGLLGMNIQGATTIFISNIKRIMKLKKESDEK